MCEAVEHPRAASAFIFCVGYGHPVVWGGLTDPVWRELAVGPVVLPVPHGEDDSQIQFFGFQQERCIVHGAVDVHVPAPPAALAHPDPRAEFQFEFDPPVFGEFHFTGDVFVFKTAFGDYAIEAGRRVDRGLPFGDERAEIGRAGFRAAGRAAEESGGSLVHLPVRAVNFEASGRGTSGFVRDADADFRRPRRACGKDGCDKELQAEMVHCLSILLSQDAGRTGRRLTPFRDGGGAWHRIHDIALRALSAIVWRWR